MQDRCRIINISWQSGLLKKQKWAFLPGAVISMILQVGVDSMKGIGEKIKRGLVSWQFLFGAGLFFLGKSLLSLSGISEGMPSMWHVFLIACSGVCALLSGVRLWWEHNGDSSKKIPPIASCASCASCDRRNFCSRLLHRFGTGPCHYDIDPSSLRITCGVPSWFSVSKKYTSKVSAAMKPFFMWCGKFACNISGGFGVNSCNVGRIMKPWKRFVSAVQEWLSADMRCFLPCHL